MVIGTRSQNAATIAGGISTSEAKLSAASS
jgi:hypothetical protein